MALEQDTLFEPDGTPSNGVQVVKSVKLFQRANKIITLDPSETTAERLGKLSNEPRDAISNVTLTVQLNDGVFTETELMKLVDFKYPVVVQGNPLDFVTGDVKSVVWNLEYDNSVVAALLVDNCSNIIFKGIHFNINGGSNLDAEMIGVRRSNARFDYCNFVINGDSRISFSSDGSISHLLDCRFGGDNGLSDMASVDGDTLSTENAQDITGRALGHSYGYAVRAATAFGYNYTGSYQIQPALNLGGLFT
jgi:hypothetical protein